MTAFTAKRDVQIEAQRRLRCCRRSQRGRGIGGDGVRGPDRKRRVIRDEVTADLGLFEVGQLLMYRACLCHTVRPQADRLTWGSRFRVHGSWFSVLSSRSAANSAQ